MWARGQLNNKDHEYFIRDARDYALVNGLVLRYEQMSSDNNVAHIPFTLFPSPFPRSLYQECLDIHPIVSSLMLKIANDIDFIEDTLSPIAQVDDFTRNLLKLNKIVQKEGLAQPVISCINRADYMLDKYIEADMKELRVRQVEVNAIASGMASHSCNIRRLQNYLFSKYQIRQPENPSITYPDNDSLTLVAQGLIEAYDTYGKSGSYVLLVAEERSLNFSDHFLIELTIHRSRPDIKFVRKSFMLLPEFIKLGPNKELILDDSKELAVVYFRYGYDPSNYNFKEAWDIRLMMERSIAIKCPSINFHLSGAKKFQQVLNNRAQLESYLNVDDARRLARVFCKFWPLDPSDPDGVEGFNVGMNSTRKLVLKPQREGGGHNIFGKAIKPFLQRIAHSDEGTQYILMEYIDSPHETNWLLQQSDFNDSMRLDKNDQLVSEVGIFGSILAEGSTIKSNKAAGYLVRSKKFGVDEGGVAMGYAGISNLILIDDSKSDVDYSGFFQD